MEAVIVALFAWIAVLILECGYSIIIALLRWAPMIPAGVLAGLIAHRIGFDHLEALGSGVLSSLLLRHILAPRFCHREEFR